MPPINEQNIPYSDSIALVNALTGGRGMPTGATGIDAAKWYHHPALSNVPGIQSIGQIISGAPGTVKPTEGITPVTGIADPIANIAGILAPFMKAYLSRQVIPGQGIPSLSFAKQRGSTGGSEGEDTLDAFKRMFMKRGGVEQNVENEGKGVVRATYEQFKNAPKGKIEIESLINDVKPRTTIDKAADVLNNWSAVSKEDFTQDLANLHKITDKKVVDKLWNHFVQEGIVASKVSDKGISIGRHVIDEDKLYNTFKHFLPNPADK